jgi:hypothetical protein
MLTNFSNNLLVLYIREKNMKKVIVSSLLSAAAMAGFLSLQDKISNSVLSDIQQNMQQVPDDARNVRFDSYAGLFTVATQITYDVEGASCRYYRRQGNILGLYILGEGKLGCIPDWAEQNNNFRFSNPLIDR